jgi:hypothetical protein
MGTIARFSIVDRRLFQYFEADKISYAASSPMRQTTQMTLISETPKVANMLVDDEVTLKTFRALIVLVVLIVLNVLSIEDNIYLPLIWYTNLLSVF